jgi:hypothetical protein
MGYLGGLGAGRGWRSFLFVVEPSVLREGLADTSPVLVIMNSRLAADYDATPLDEEISGVVS